MQYKDCRWLKQQYNNGKTSIEIAKICSVSSNVITYHLRKIGIKHKKITRIFGDKKKCDSCKKLLLLLNFKKRPKNSYDGYLNICKKCYNIRYSDKIKEYNRKPEVKERVKLAGKNYAKNNKEKLNANVRKRWALIKNNISVRINNIMSSRINRVLKGSI